MQTLKSVAWAIPGILVLDNIVSIYVCAKFSQSPFISSVDIERSVYGLRIPDWRSGNRLIFFRGGGDSYKISQYTHTQWANKNATFWYGLVENSANPKEMQSFYVDVSERGFYCCRCCFEYKMCFDIF